MQVAKATAADGLEIGVPHPYTEPRLPNHFGLLIGLAIAPVVWFAAAGFIEDRRIRTAGAVVVGLLALACYTKTGAQLMALMAAAAAPVVAFQLVDDLALRFKGPEWARILQAFLLVSAVSLVGGLVVAGMLNGLPYYVKADEFKGIKVAVFLPVLGVGWYAFTHLTDWRGNLRSPITWGAVLLSVFLAARWPSCWPARATTAASARAARRWPCATSSTASPTSAPARRSSSWDTRC